MNAHQRKKNAKAFIAELKAYCDDEKVSSLLEAADDLRKLNKENEQLRQRVAELEKDCDEYHQVALNHIHANEKLTAERDSAYKIADHYRDERDALEFSWAGCRQQLKDVCADLDAVEAERDALKQQRDMLLSALALGKI